MWKVVNNSERVTILLFFSKFFFRFLVNYLRNFFSKNRKLEKEWKKKQNN
jgi:hypothetical protein